MIKPLTKPIEEIPAVFGTVFAPEMPIAYFRNQKWETTKWQASDSLTLHPASHALHYSSEIFEGMKAFRHQDGSVHIFRLDDGVNRMIKSAAAIYLPLPDFDQTRQMIIDAVAKAHFYVPDNRGSLYIRPTLIGITPNIGSATQPSQDALMYILLSPVGDYLKQGDKLKVLVETKNLRCAPHMGSVKSGGNYASALHWAKQAFDKYGAKQVLFCPDDDVQETGASNFILIDGNTLITKPLTSEFLHGITRKTVLRIAKDNGYQIDERNFTVSELKQKIINGAEAILTGTAAVISPISSFVIDDEEFLVKDNQKSLQIRKLITDIQYGNCLDKHNWLTKVC